MEKMKCNLCHHILFNPKILPCTHTFCCTCLVDTFSFNKDGSAIFQFPKECKGVVNVGSTISINSMLCASFEFQQVLDVLKDDVKKE